jgi:hypothetical protein
MGVSDSNAVIPVIVGLATGAAFIVVIAILFVSFTNQSTASFPRDDYHFQVSVAGLKDSYEAGERIDFVMKIKGFGDTCANPNFAIRNANTLEVIWYSKSVISVCDPAPKLVDVSLRQEDLSMGRAPLFINVIGTYEFKASYIDSNIVGGSFDVKAAK